MTSRRQNGPKLYNDTGSITERDSLPGLEQQSPTPVLLVAYSPPASENNIDRIQIDYELTVGRKPPCDLTVPDHSLSKAHFHISGIGGNAFYIEDLGSTNGTYIDGLPLRGKQRLKSSTVIRAGQSLFVFQEDGAHLLRREHADPHGFAGRFHVDPLLGKLTRYAEARCNILLAGPTGSGKELAAGAIAAIARRGMVVHNAAQFTSEAEATATLFGVQRRTFTGVDDREGLIESADGGILFLDEAHNLPLQVQKSLLRVIEEWHTSRIGSRQQKRVDVRFVFASNAATENYGLAHDFLARMRVVDIAPLTQRVADIPDIFRHVLAVRMAHAGIEPAEVVNALNADHYELLCLDGFPEFNVRGLIRLSQDIIDELRDMTPEAALRRVFEHRYRGSAVMSRGAYDAPRRFSPSPSSRAGNRRFRDTADGGLETRDGDDLCTMQDLDIDAVTLELIKNTYYECRAKVSDMAAFLKKKHDVRLSRRRISKILDGLGLPRLKRIRSK
jgi:DNA-binding NtrC family response regulator